MNIFEAIFYGIVQGLTEFLPVSSSGHLAIIQSLPFLSDIFGENENSEMLFFNILLHLGTLLAVFIFFRSDVYKLLAGFFSLLKKIFTGKIGKNKISTDEYFVVLVLIATVPLVIAALLEDKIAELMTNGKIIGGLLLLNAFILFISDRLKASDKNEKNASAKDAFGVGMCQLVAVVPGISRSGATITGGLIMGFDREFAVKFSFIMSIPAILGANLFSIIKAMRGTTDISFSGADTVSYIAGMAAAFIVGIAAIKVLRALVRKRSFFVFAIYCAIVGILTMIFA